MHLMQRSVGPSCGEINHILPEDITTWSFKICTHLQSLQTFGSQNAPLAQVLCLAHFCGSAEYKKHVEQMAFQHSTKLLVCSMCS